jgi:hypothetical protein
MIDSLRELPIGHTLTVREQRGRVTQLCGALLNHCGEDALAIARNGRRQIQTRSHAFPGETLLGAGAIVSSELTPCSPRPLP